MGKQTIPAPTTCTIAGCEKPHRARGVCDTHYQQMRKSGTIRAIRDIPDDERFDQRWHLDATTGCHVWLRGKDSSGYGKFSLIGGKHVRAHVYAWTRANGPVPEGLVLDHFVCENKACCNPAHLRAVPMLANLMRRPGVKTFDPRTFTHDITSGCVNGHAWTPENTYIRRDTGTRQCRACGRNRQRTPQAKAARHQRYLRTGT